MDQRVDTVQGLWIGESLSPVEQLCIRSFLANGHDFHLYTYQPLKGVPPGTVLRDANKILPESSIFTYQTGASLGSVAGFSNWFRYELLHRRGGWWADLDMVCLRKFPEYGVLFFAKEWKERRSASRLRQFVADRLCKQREAPYLRPRLLCQQKPCSGLIYSPPEHPFLAEIRDRAASMSQSPEKLEWGATGPRLIERQVTRWRWKGSFKLGNANEFMPFSFREIDLLFDPEVRFDISKCFALHLYNEIWRRRGIDKHQKFATGCLLESLMSRFGVR